MKLIARLKIFLKKNILVLVLIILCYFPIFHKLGDKNIRMWDESFYAVSAFEMSQNGNFLIKHFNNIPDIYNLKPPLVTWFQVICMKIFGYNELAVRIPSALSAFILVLIIIRFFKKDLNRPILGYFTALVIVTTDGFINSHVTRTGDYEAPLVLFLFISFMYFYKYVEFGNKRNKYLVLSTVFYRLLSYQKA